MKKGSLQEKESCISASLKERTLVRSPRSAQTKGTQLETSSECNGFVIVLRGKPRQTTSYRSEIDKREESRRIPTFAGGNLNITTCMTKRIND